MRSLISYLCETLQCNLDELTERIRGDIKKTKRLLKDLPLYTSHSQHRSVLRCDGVTKAGPRTLFSNGGFLGITVEQFIHTKYDIVLDHPQLPCIIIRFGDTGGEVYYPIELTLCDL